MDFDFESDDLAGEVGLPFSLDNGGDYRLVCITAVKDFARGGGHTMTLTVFEEDGTKLTPPSWSKKEAVLVRSFVNEDRVHQTREVIKALFPELDGKKKLRLKVNSDDFLERWAYAKFREKKQDDEQLKEFGRDVEVVCLDRIPDKMIPICRKAHKREFNRDLRKLELPSDTPVSAPAETPTTPEPSKAPAQTANTNQGSNPFG